MTVEDLRVLVDNLDEYIHIPGGIERLKKTVLHLAVSGQLVPQDSTEGTGAELYKVIQTTKAKLITEGKLKKQKPLPPITDDETPFAIPASWEWVRLADVGEIIGGGTPPSGNIDYYTDDHENSIAWLTPADLRGYKNIYISHGAKNITEQGLKNSSARLMPKGTVLFSSRAPIGHIAIADNEVTTNQGFKSVVPYENVHSEFIYRWLQYYAPTIDANASGTTFREVSGAIVSVQQIPLPPLAEQKRIVAKVDEIFALIDRLSVAYQTEETERSAFVRSSLRSLSHDGSSLVLENLASTIRTKADAAELRKAILHLAVSGQLVPQNPHEGTGAELYKDIQITKAKLVSVGKLKKAKPLPPITPDETPFAIPESWEWVKLGDASVYQQRGKSPKYTEYSDFPVISQRCVRTDAIDWSVIKYITAESVEKYEDFRFLQNGDLLLNSTGTGTMGRVGIFQSNKKYEQVVADSHVTVVRFSDDIAPKFAHIWLNAPYIQDDVESKASGSTNQIEWNLSSIQNEVIPLPPLAEQKRIVQKTTHLLNLVTELEKHLEK